MVSFPRWPGPASAATQPPADRLEAGPAGEPPAKLPGVRLAAAQERMAVLATLPATFLPAPLIIEQSLYGTVARVQGLDQEFTPEVDAQGRLSFQLDPIGPRVLYDPANRDFGLATPVERDDSGLLYRKYQEIFHADGSRTIVRDEYSEPSGDGKSYLRVHQAADGRLSASQRLERGGKTVREIPLSARRLDSAVWHDIQLQPGSLGSHLRANGLGGLVSWARRGRAVSFFEPLSERPGTRFPVLRARLELGGEAAVPTPPAPAEPHSTPYREQLKIQLLGDRVRVGSIELQRRKLQAPES